MVAVAALAKLAIPIGLGLAFASSKKPAAGPQTMQNMLLVAPNGVVVVDPKMAPWVLQSLSSQYVVPSGNALFEEVALNATGGPGYTNALLWAQAKAAAGKLVLILIDGGKGLAAVAPGQEVELCQRKGGRYAVLLEPPAQAAGLPTPTPTPNPFPAPTPNPQQWGDVLGQLGGQLGQAIGLPPNPQPTPNPFPSPTPNPPGAAYTHTIRSGDIASRLAQWYTGSAYRWQELSRTNPELKLVLQNGQPYGYSPWRIGQILVLPPGWDGSKGPPVQTMSAPRSSPVVSGWR